MTDTVQAAGHPTGRHAPGPDGDVRSPTANRLVRPRWLNPRLVVGVLLVLVSVAVGARLLAAADRTVPVLVAAEDLVPGQPLTGDLVEPSGALLESGLDRYVTDVGTGYLVVRPVERGELLPRSAIKPTGEAEDVRQVTVAVPASEAPAGLRPGDAVDVWLVPEGEDVRASLLLPAARVTAATSGGGGLGAPTGQHRVTLAVTAVESPEAGEPEDGTAAEDGDASEEAVDLEAVTAELVAAARAGRVYLTRLPEAVP